MRRALVLVPLFLLPFTGTAKAETADQVAAALRTSPVFQAKGLDLVDVATLTAELQGSDPKLDLAVLPASAAASSEAARQRAVEIGRALGDRDAVVLVITANEKFGVGRGSAVAARGVDVAGALTAELTETKGQEFTKDNLTAFVTSYQERLAQQVSRGAAAGGETAGGESGGGESGGNGGTFLLGGLLLAGGGATALVIRSSRNRKKRLNEGLRADVEQLYNRLGSDVATLDPGDDVVARQALADAAERYNACGATLATADGPAEFAAARRTAVEGLTAARTARRELGFDPGPEIAPVPGDGPQLRAEQQVVLGGQAYDGSPDYQPGRQHYFSGGNVGGQNVPGGWYSMPFWEPFMLGALLTGGFGGGFGGFGSGGHEQGHGGEVDAEGDSGDPGNTGSDFGGGSGGGDWGGGPGDSGGGGAGGSGGGDWGGGPGDSGGGDSGGDW